MIRDEKQIVDIPAFAAIVQRAQFASVPVERRFKDKPSDCPLEQVQKEPERLPRPLLLWCHVTTRAVAT